MGLTTVQRYCAACDDPKKKLACMGDQSNCFFLVFLCLRSPFLGSGMNVENVHSSGHSPVSQIATHILWNLSSAVCSPALNSSAGSSSGPVLWLCDLLSDGSHEQPLNEVVEALAPNIIVQFHSLPHHGTSLHNTLSTCLQFVQLQSNFRQLLTGYIAGVAETLESGIHSSETLRFAWYVFI